MELVFTLENGKYVAYAQVNADYNVHLERIHTGGVAISQTTISGKSYAPVFSEYKPSIVDLDFDGIVYPKYIKIISDTYVSEGAVTEVG